MVWTGSTVFESRKRWVSRVKQRESELAFPPLFLLNSHLQWVEWCPSIQMRVLLLSLLSQVPISSRNILTDTPPEIMFHLLSGHPFSQLSWYMEIHTITSVNYCQIQIESCQLESDLLCESQCHHDLNQSTPWFLHRMILLRNDMKLGERENKHSGWQSEMDKELDRQG